MLDRAEEKQLEEKLLLSPCNKYILNITICSWHVYLFFYLTYNFLQNIYFFSITVNILETVFKFKLEFQHLNFQNFCKICDNLLKAPLKDLSYDTKFIYSSFGRNMKKIQKTSKKDLFILWSSSPNNDPRTKILRNVVLEWIKLWF